MKKILVLSIFLLHNEVMKKIIIAPYSMHKDLLYSLRKNNPFVQLKMFTKETLCNEVYGQFSEESKISLMKKMEITYDLADEIVSYLPYFKEINSKKGQEVGAYKSELIKEGHYLRNALIKEEFKNAEVEIYGYSKDDRTLIEALRRIEASYHFSDLDTTVPTFKVYKFDTVEDEVFYLLNNVCYLIDSGISPKDIYVYNIDETYAHYIRAFQESFNLRFNNIVAPSLYLSGYCSEFFKFYKKYHDIDVALKELEEVVGKDKGEDLNFIYLKEKILENVYPDLPYYMQLDILKSRLKRIKRKEPYFINGVNIIDSPIHTEKKHIFILGFALNVLPRTYKDNEYFSNKEKEGTNLLLSNEKSKIEKDLFLDFINSNNYFHFSYASSSLTKKFYPSSLIEDADKEVIDNPPDMFLYSKKMLDYLHAKEMDLKIKYGEISEDLEGYELINEIPYMTYDNKFTGINYFDINSHIKYSYSSINLYASCPFSYYLNYVLKINTFEERLNTVLGSIIHETLEHVYEPDFDLDKEFQKASESHGFNKGDQIKLERIKEQIRDVVKNILLHYRQNECRSSFIEKKMTFDLSDNITLEGKLDKVITFNNRYYIIVDYKTYKIVLDHTYIKEGLGIQLPLYSILCDQEEDLSHLEGVGYYYQTVVSNKYYPGISSDISFSKLNGISLKEANFGIVDESLKEGKSAFIDGLSLNKEGMIKDNKKVISFSEFDSYKKDTLEAINNIDSKIRKNEFPISPYFITGRNTGCSFCQFRDICYRKLNDYRELGDEEMEEEDHEILS